MRKIGFFFGAGVFLLLSPLAAFAQTIPLNDFSLTLTPANPAPYENMVLSLGSGSVDLTNATFKVYVNGSLAASGTGSQSVSLTAGAPGSSMTIRVLVFANGKTYKKTLVVHPVSVALVVEPLSTVPPFYRGGALVPAHGSVRVVAVPTFYTSRGAYINPSTLSYTWSVNNDMLPGASGVGQSSVVVPSPLPYREETVSVQVQNGNGSLIAQKSVSLMPQNPFVLIYKDDPLMGVEYSHALSGQESLGGAEASFVAVPYGFSTQNGGPLFSWFLNGEQVQTGNMITVKPQGAGKGIASLSVSASSPETFEIANANLAVQFGTSSAGGFGLFGL